MEKQVGDCIMAKSKRTTRRTKGAGYIVKPAGYKRYCLRIRVNGQQKLIPLSNPDGTPCTTMVEAEKASRNQQKILQAETKQEVVNFIAEVKQLKCNAPHLSRVALRKSGKKVCFRVLRESVMPG